MVKAAAKSSCFSAAEGSVVLSSAVHSNGLSLPRLEIEDFLRLQFCIA